MPSRSSQAAAPVVVASAGGDAKGLLAANACTACHGISNKIVGPGFNEVVSKNKGRADLEGYLVNKIKNGGSGVYGAVPMPAQPQLSDADARTLAQWIAAGAK